MIRMMQQLMDKYDEVMEEIKKRREEQTELPEKQQKVNKKKMEN